MDVAAAFATHRHPVPLAQRVQPLEDLHRARPGRPVRPPAHVPPRPGDVGPHGELKPLQQPIIPKEDLGEKVTEAEWTLLWLAAETEDRARRHEPEATAREDGHEVADAPGEDTRGLRRGRSHRTNL